MNAGNERWQQGQNTLVETVAIFMARERTAPHRLATQVGNGGNMQEIGRDGGIRTHGPLTPSPIQNSTNSDHKSLNPDSLAPIAHRQTVRNSVIESDDLWPVVTPNPCRVGNHRLVNSHFLLETILYVRALSGCRTRLDALGTPNRSVAVDNRPGFADCTCLKPSPATGRPGVQKATTMIRFAVLSLAALSFTACAGSPTAPSSQVPSTTPTTFHVVSEAGAPLSDIKVCPGEAACVATDAAGVAIVGLAGETMVIFRGRPETQGERFQPSTTPIRVVLH